ncbi:hypothetical protein [Variovorax fucosicus]|uniref:hypothetical protein n=1 Tax=Variovorax fucosicus TaxID=3053517 RepID=UPI004037AD0E
MTEHKRELRRSAHPIDPAGREQIMASLAHIERRYGVTVRLACESGSCGADPVLRFDDGALV